METSFAGSSQVYNSEVGEFISEAHRTLATVLKDYKPTFSLVYIPMKDRITQQDREKPFAILDSPPGLPAHIVRYLTEAEMKDTPAVLSWIFKGDLMKHRPNDIMAQIEAEEAATQLLQQRQREAELEDIIEFGSFVASGGREKLHNFRHNGIEFKR